MTEDWLCFQFLVPRAIPRAATFYGAFEVFFYFSRSKSALLGRIIAGILFLILVLKMILSDVASMSSSFVRAASAS